MLQVSGTTSMTALLQLVSQKWWPDAKHISSFTCGARSDYQTTSHPMVATLVPLSLSDINDGLWMSGQTLKLCSFQFWSDSLLLAQRHMDFLFFLLYVDMNLTLISGLKAWCNFPLSNPIYIVSKHLIWLMNSSC